MERNRDDVILRCEEEGNAEFNIDEEQTTGS